MGCMRSAKAVVIGIDNYPAHPLGGCVADATAVAQLLEYNADGSKNFDVELLTAPSASIGRARLREAARSAFSGKPDIALFYFSGHGMLDPASGYLVSQDYSRFDEGLAMSELMSIADAADSCVRHRIIVLDCCHSGALGFNPNLAEGSVTLRNGTTILAASRSLESAVEVAGQGLFTSFVVDALDGSAADLLGNVTPGLVYAHIDRSLGAFDQRPIFRTNVEEFVCLRKAKAPIELVDLQRITCVFEDPEKPLQLNPGYEKDSGVSTSELRDTMVLLQKYRYLDLLRPEDGDHVPVDQKGAMYHAAMNSRSCELTPLGKYYHHLRKTKRF